MSGRARRRSRSTTARSRCRRAPASSRRLRAAGHRDPGLLLRAAARPAGRRLPHVPRRDRGAAEAAGRLHADRHGRDGRQDRARTSEKAAEGQNATLEFILVNHPLDCPVCDKGGECPLQDLTFRYGPGQHADDLPEADASRSRSRSRRRSRSTASAASSATAARASRRTWPRTTSSSRATAALTVDDRDVRGRAVPRRRSPATSIELCPGRRAHVDAVPLRGAAVGHPERARRSAASARSAATSARRRARARSSASSRATIPRSTAAGSATRAASRYPHLHAGRPDPPSRSRVAHARARADLAGTTRSTAPRSCCAAPRSRIVTALSGSETIEQAYALGAAPARRARRPRRPCCRSRPPIALDAFRLPLSAIAEAEIVVVVGDDEVADRAPVVDLWLEAARRNGAEVVATVRRARRSQPGPSSRAARARRAGQRAGRRAARLRARRSWSGPGRGGGGARLAEAAHALGFDGQARLRRLPPARRRRTARRRRRPGQRPPTRTRRTLSRSACSIVSGDEAAADSCACARSPSSAEQRDRDHDVPRPRRRLGRPRPARDELRSSVTARCSTSKAACSACGAHVIAAGTGRARLDREARRALRRRASHRTPSVVFDELSALMFGGVDGRELNGAPGCPRATPTRRLRRRPSRAGRRRRPPGGDHFLGELRLQSATGRSSPGRWSSASPSSQFQRPPAELELSAADAAQARRSRTETPSSSARTAPRSSFARACQPQARRGRRTRRRRARRRPPPDGRGGRSRDAARSSSGANGEPWWIAADQGGRSSSTSSSSRSRT